MKNSTNLSRRQFLRRSIGSSVALASMAAAPSVLSSSLINADQTISSDTETRILNLRNLHTKEHIRIAYAADGQILQKNHHRLSLFLRDHRQNEAMLMDTGLFDQLWQIQKNMPEDCTFEIISGYRSPKTNAMLRANSNAVARRSYHMRGKALDIRVIGVPTATVRKHATALQAGGVGYYPSSKFVHLDTGPVRTWTS